MTVGVLLLAGGHSRRFGSDKRVAGIGDGRTLLQAALDNVRGTGLPLLVCLGAADDDLEHTLLAAGIRCRKCPRSRQGMGSTLADGIGAIAGSWRGALVALADMPAVRPATYRLIRDKLGPGKIVVPTIDKKRGHPVGFDRSYFRELLALSGDRGARGIVAGNPGAIVELAVDDPGILVDVDAPRDLRYLKFPRPLIHRPPPAHR